MPEQISQIIIIATGALVGMLLWAFSIAYVYLDSNRRGLPGSEQFIWVLLSALLPLIGFFAYLFAGGLSRFISPGSLRTLEPRGPTLSKPAEEHKYTVMAAHPQPHAPASRKSGSRRERTLSKASQAYDLEVIEGPHKGEIFRLGKLPALVGRGSQTFLRLDNDLGVSRLHAELYEQDGELYIKDLNSNHGIHVNGYKIGDTRLESGDQVRLGVSVLTVKINGTKHAN
jgi:hypothetical protein